MGKRDMRFISLKMDTGYSTLVCKSSKGSEGCIMNAMPVILLKAIIVHLQKIIDHKEATNVQESNDQKDS